MTYLKFDKTELVDLQYSASKELLRTNRSGSYSSTTVSGCNTRKYHGLLVSPIKAFNDAMHVLLSSLDITIIQHEQEFNLGLHKYQGNHYDPKGHKYLKDFRMDNIPTLTYQVGGVILAVSKILIEDAEQVLVKITLEKAHSATKLRLKPILSFRNIHELSSENLQANSRVQYIKNGIIAKMYENYPELCMQTSVKNEFVNVPLWYHAVEYMEEQKRGYAYKEDLFSPGYFETPIGLDESIYFSASLKVENPLKLATIFDEARRKRINRKTYLDCLHNAAQQFFRKTTDGVEMLAGYPWYGSIPRDTLIAAPTLAFENNDYAGYLKLIDRLLNNLELNSREIWGSKQVSVDAPLWLFNSLYQYKEYVPKAKIWESYGLQLKNILNAYKSNELYHIEYMTNGLLYVYNESKPLTWMNSQLNDKAIVKRFGYLVEVCALWYNAICCSLDWAKDEGDLDFIDEWTPIKQLVEQNYTNTFSDETHNYLADYATFSSKNFDFRPNQLIAIALPYTPISLEKIASVKRLVKQELLTPKGVRTLSPQHFSYAKNYEGNPVEREQKAHQGTVYPWLLVFYCQAYCKVHKRSVPNVLQQMFEAFEEDMTSYGIGTIGELYDADPPYREGGAISMATSVAAVLRIYRLREWWLMKNSKQSKEKSL